MLWAEVYGADGVKVGTGPILVKTVSVSRVLDGPGTLSMSVIYDEKNESYLTVGRTVFVYKRETPPSPFDGGSSPSVRLIASGVIRKRKRQYSNSPTMTVDGVDLLEELKFRNTLLNRQYDVIPLATVVESLAALGGWTATVEVSDILLSLRVDGVSILKALQDIVKNNGLHLRTGATTRQVEVGNFGANVGLTLINSDSAMVGGDGFAILETLSIDEEGDQIINRLYPIGAGEGEAALTLKNSTRSGILSKVGADGELIYYLEDAASIAKYGVREKMGVFKDIAPLNNSVLSKQIAANALCDAGLAYLERSSEPIRRYSAGVGQCFKTLRAGDKVRVDYAGLVRDPEGDETFERLNEMFWIIKVSESHSEGSASINLELANIDKVRMDSAKVIVGALENLELRNLKPQAYPYANTFVYSDVVSNNTNPTFSRWADFKLRIDNSVSDITRVRVRFETTKLFTYSHSRLEPGKVTVNSLPYVSPGIFDSIFYSINESNNYPSGLSFYFNGVDVSATFGGPWNVGLNVVTDIELDITDLVLNAAGGIYQTHTMQIRCENRIGDTAIPGSPVVINGDVSHGIVICTMSIQGTAQAIIST